MAGLNPDEFAGALKGVGAKRIFGVPDTTLAPLFRALGSDLVITPNEGLACSAAFGSFLAEGGLPTVALQNSGLGICINPILSLTNIHTAPLLLIIAMRGDGPEPDAIQHRLQGPATRPLLAAAGLHVFELPAGLSQPLAHEMLARAARQAQTSQAATALLLPRDLFGSERVSRDTDRNLPTRDQAIREIVSHLGGSDFIVGTTGYISRALGTLVTAGALRSDQVFLTVGAMGHAAGLSLGYASARRDAGRVICLDGDGAMLMHLGAAAQIAASGRQNLLHVVLNNNCHDSVGAIPTSSPRLALKALAEAMGYRLARVAASLAGLSSSLEEALASAGPGFIEVRIQAGQGEAPPRPAAETITAPRTTLSAISTDVDPGARRRKKSETS